MFFGLREELGRWVFVFELAVMLALCNLLRCLGSSVLIRIHWSPGRARRGIEGEGMRRVDSAVERVRSCDLCCRACRNATFQQLKGRDIAIGFDIVGGP